METDDAVKMDKRAKRLADINRQREHIRMLSVEHGILIRNSRRHTVRRRRRRHHRRRLL